MVLRNITLILFLGFSLFPINIIRAETTAGFLPKDIWYSKDTLQDGEKVKIYTAIWNGDTRQLSGVVSFYDNTTLLGKKNFTIAGKKIQDLSIDWTVTVGSHSIYAKIDKATYLQANGTKENITLSYNTTEKDTFTVKKKVVLEAKDENATSAVNEIDQIATSVKENTPNIIAKPIVRSIEALESFRVVTENMMDARKTGLNVELKKIETQKETQTPESPKIETGDTSKPLKQAELFFVNVGLLVFSHKLLYYVIIALLLYFFLINIWRMVAH